MDFPGRLWVGDDQAVREIRAPRHAMRWRQRPAAKAAGMCRGIQPSTTSTASQVAEIMVALPGEPDLCGRGDAGPLSIADRPGRLIELFARVRLHKDQKVPAARDDADLTDRAAPASLQNPKAFADQKGRRAAFRRDAQPKRNPALRLRDPPAFAGPARVCGTRPRTGPPPGRSFMDAVLDAVLVAVLVKFLGE
jgi:hypothetical protein